MTIAIIGAGAMGGSLAEGLLSLKAPSPSTHQGAGAPQAAHNPPSHTTSIRVKTNKGDRKQQQRKEYM